MVETIITQCEMLTTIPDKKDTLMTLKKGVKTLRNKLYQLRSQGIIDFTSIKNDGVNID